MCDKMEATKKLTLLIGRLCIPVKWDKSAFEITLELSLKRPSFRLTSERLRSISSPKSSRDTLPFLY